MGNPLPKLKELMISDVQNWTSLQAAIEKRFKNGDKSLRKIQLPRGRVPDIIMRHLTQWLPKQGIELVLYESGEWLALAPPEVQDDFCSELSRLFEDVAGNGAWGDPDSDHFIYSDDDDDDDDDEDYDQDPEFWEDWPMGVPGYYPPNDVSDELYDEFDDEGEGEGDVEDDFYEG